MILSDEQLTAMRLYPERAHVRDLVDSHRAQAEKLKELETRYTLLLKMEADFKKGLEEARAQLATVEKENEYWRGYQEQLAECRQQLAAAQQQSNYWQMSFEEARDLKVEAQQRVRELVLRADNDFLLMEKYKAKVTALEKQLHDERDTMP